MVRARIGPSPTRTSAAGWRRRAEGPAGHSRARARSPSGSNSGGQEREPPGLRHGALEGVHAALDRDLLVDLAASARQLRAEVAVAGDVGERGGEVLTGRGGRASSALRSAIATSPGGADVGLQTIGRPAATASRTTTPKGSKSEGRTKTSAAAYWARELLPGRCSRRSAPARRAAPQAPAARPRAARCRRRGARLRSAVRPLRANASIRPPTFLSGTSRADGEEPDGPVAAGRRGGRADRLGIEGLEADLDGLGRGAEREEPLAGGAARRDEPLRTAREPAVEPELRARQPLDDPRRVLAEDHERDAAAGAPGPRAQRGRPVLPGHDDVGVERVERTLEAARPHDRRPAPALALKRAQVDRVVRVPVGEPRPLLIPAGRPAGLVDHAQGQRRLAARPANSGSR